MIGTWLETSGAVGDLGAGKPRGHGAGPFLSVAVRAARPVPPSSPASAAQQDSSPLGMRSVGVVHCDTASGESAARGLLTAWLRDPTPGARVNRGSVPLPSGTPPRCHASSGGVFGWEYGHATGPPVGVARSVGVATSPSDHPTTRSAGRAADRIAEGHRPLPGYPGTILDLRPARDSGAACAQAAELLGHAGAGGEGR
jgi:hypothetical protein